MNPVIVKQLMFFSKVFQEVSLSYLVMKAAGVVQGQILEQQRLTRKTSGVRTWTQKLVTTTMEKT